MDAEEVANRRIFAYKQNKKPKKQALKPTYWKKMFTSGLNSIKYASSSSGDGGVLTFQLSAL